MSKMVDVKAYLAPHTKHHNHYCAVQHFLEPSQSSSVLHVITQAGGWCFGQEPDFTVDYDRKHHRNRGLLESSVMPQFYYYESVQLINKKTL